MYLQVGVSAGASRAHSETSRSHPLSHMSTTNVSDSSIGLPKNALNKAAQRLLGMQPVWMKAAAQGNRTKESAMVWRALRLQHPNIGNVIGVVWEFPDLVSPVTGGAVPVIVRSWQGERRGRPAQAPMCVFSRCLRPGHLPPLTPAGPRLPCCTRSPCLQSSALWSS